MGSLAAEKVAQDVLVSLGRGKRPNVAKIAVQHGYTVATAYSGAIQNTLTYKRIVDPIVEKLEKARHKAVDSLGRKNFDEVEPLALSVISKNLTHDIQLLSGKSPENTPNEDKNVIINVLQIVRGSDNGSTEPYIESKKK